MADLLFSVIVPVYNVENYLSDCVKSVVEQTGPRDWECILVDDGSTDASGKICDFFAAECPGVRVIHQANQGLAGARNTGVEAAKGEWILYLDSDDLWPAGMLAGLREILAAQPGFDWYVGRYRELNPDGSITEPGAVDFLPGVEESECYADRVARLYRCGHWAVWKYCLRRSFLQQAGIRFWPEVRWAEDYPYDLLLLKACRRICFVDHQMTVYRANREGSLVNSNLPRHFDGILAAQQGFARLFAGAGEENDRLVFTPAEQAEVWRRVANAFWPEARAAAARDRELRRACAPGVTRCRPLYDFGDQCRGRADWVAFRWMLKLLGAPAGLWLAARLKG